MASACTWRGFEPGSNRRLSPPGRAVVNPGPTSYPPVRVVRPFAIGPTSTWTTPPAQAQNRHHRLSIVQERYSLSVRAAPQITATPNNGLQLTRAARCAPSPSDWGQSLRAALAAEAGCSAPSWSQETDLFETVGPAHSALSASERQGRQPRSKNAWSRCEWLGGQPRQRASSSASEARGSHPPQANHLGSWARAFLGFKKERLFNSAKGSLLDLRVGRPQHPSLGIDQPRMLIEPVSPIAQITVAQNNALEPARSTQTDCGPRGSMRCWTDLAWLA